jgi:hypothetical protein
VLIYVPTKRPETDEQKQADPFALYAECGAVFPQDDGDEYSEPLPARQTGSRHRNSPGVCQVSCGADLCGDRCHRRRRELAATASNLRVESGREILAALLAPSASQAEALKGQEGWVQEARDFLARHLGLEREDTRQDVVCPGG